jgi:hypothetical protein
MGLLELTTNLKSLKYEGPNKPLITKDINDPPKTGGISMQVNHRIDDLVRHTKLLVKKPGLKFLGNQALLAQTNIKQDIKKQKGKSFKEIAKVVGNRIKDTAINTVLATGSILGQIPVNGTGTHLIRGLKPITHLKGGPQNGIATLSAPDGTIIPNGSPKDGLGSFVVDDNYQITSLGDIRENIYHNGEKWIVQFGNLQRTSPKDYLSIQGNATENTKQGQKAFPDNDGTSPGQENIQGGSKLKQKETPLSNLAKPSNKLELADPFVDGTGTKNQDISYIGTKEDGTVEGAADRDYRLYQDNKVALDVKVPSAVKGETVQIELNTENGNYKEVKLINDSDKRVARISAKAKPNYENYSTEITTNSNTSTDKARATREKGLTDKPDPVQSLSVETASILGTGKEDIIPFEFNTFYPGNTTGNFLYFRAFLNSFNDNYSGNWSGTKYVGRGEELFNYEGFTRDISFDFKIAAFSKVDIEPLYKKLNLLVGSTAPTYGTGQFMKGTLTKVTIGDYLKATPGFISSIGLSWDSNTPWELEGDKRLPHVLDVNVSFTPIHDFVPTAESTFIG